MRLHSVDFLRGLALTIVLLDHVDLWARPASGFIRDWSLMGLGFSDAAEAFVFLSGFVFGWGYRVRIVRDGFVACQMRVLGRTLQIYGGYLATVAIIASLGVVVSDMPSFAYSALDVENVSGLPALLLDAMRLMYQPFALGILCMYVVLLPFLLLWLAVYRRWWWVGLGLSVVIYGTVQIEPSLNLPTHGGGKWFFNPFAWQFLLVLGLVCGQRSRHEQRGMTRVRMWTLLAFLVIAFGLFVKKVVPLFDHLKAFEAWKSVDSWILPLLSKTSLGPLRLLHFLAVAHLVTLALSRFSGFLSHPIAKPLIACGRHSLSVYCAGTVLAYLSLIAFRVVGSTPVTLFVISLDVCLLQFAFAAWLDRPRERLRRGITSYETAAAE